MWAPLHILNDRPSILSHLLTTLDEYTNYSFKNSHVQCIKSYSSFKLMKISLKTLRHYLQMNLWIVRRQEFEINELGK